MQPSRKTELYWTSLHLFDGSRCFLSHTWWPWWWSLLLSKLTWPWLPAPREEVLQLCSSYWTPLEFDPPSRTLFMNALIDTYQSSSCNPGEFPQIEKVTSGRKG